MELVNFELIKKIFLHINRTEKQAELLPDRKKWNKLISALHTLEDSSNAVKYYVESIYPTDVGGKYLFTYGLFQAMILQQDSAKSINQTLFNKSINFKSEYPHAYSVRELRNDTTGHPTNRNGDEKFISLAQISLEKYSFYYCKDDYKDAEKNSIIDVNVEEAISNTSKCINDILQKAVERLDKEFKEYIDKHKNRKMADIFNGLRNAKEKVFTSKMYRWEYEATKSMVEECENELKQRYGSVAADDGYNFFLDDIHKLYALIDNIGDISTKSQKRYWHYLVKLLFVKLHKLESCCEETDKYFENYGETVIDEKNEVEDVSISIIYSKDGEKWEKILRQGTNNENI